MIRGVIQGTGSYLPEYVLTNGELEKLVETSDEWITSRTGISSRRIAGPGEETSKISAEAARRAMAMAGITAEEIGMIIVGTITSEMTMPSCACLVQKEIGAVNAFAFDLSAACSGFIYGLELADKQIRAYPDKKILVIGAENLSARVNWKDRNTCVLFGDGAGAVIVGADESGRGLLASKLFSDGRLGDLLYMNAAPSMNPYLGMDRTEAADFDPARLGCPRPDDGSYIRMSGREVFKNAVLAMESSIDQVLEAAGVKGPDIDWIIPHQANIRILHNLGERIGVPKEKIFINIHKYGNTSAATVPIALDEANRGGLLKKGDLILTCAFGGGFTWGAEILRW
ncbi:MAG: ketoacyl-ACP synthase III [Proteobacteria bacterium]|nr:ketoacyl-ACP synthase III [Pseudomonadota bacterium]MBU1736765.1 ketoacyl-ACP synthase III [Pseudomonadota bacterium]